MKDFLGLGAAMLISVGLSVSFVWGVVWFIQSFPAKPLFPPCTQSVKTYSWVGPAGGTYDTGTDDVELATKIAAGRPLKMTERCVAH